jgi:hypothetical protein
MTDQPEGKYQLSPAENDPEIIRLLGLITARWATMDEVLERLLSKLMRNPPAAQVIYYSLESFGARLDVITSLVVELMKEDHPLKKQLVTLLNRVNRLSAVRNKLTHTNMSRLDNADVAPLWHCHACHSASQNPEWPFFGLFGAFRTEVCGMWHEMAATPATPATPAASHGKVATVVSQLYSGWHVSAYPPGRVHRAYQNR